MKYMKHICFVVNRYPSVYEPYMLIFLQRLAWNMADLGKKVSVICPLQLNLDPKFRTLPYYEVERTPNGAEIGVYRPKTIGCGQSRLILGKSPVRITTFFMEQAEKKVLERMEEKPDVIYGHFLAPAGILAARLGRRFKIPAFFAFGEVHDTIWQFGRDKVREEFSDICGVIAVSSYLKNKLVDSGVVPENKVRVFPNAVDSRYFYPHDKREARRKFGLPEEGLLASFVGSFDERKGIDRVCRALDQTEGIRLICAGQGNVAPSSSKCIFAQPVRAENIAEFNSAADMFVLPTRNEGCCNAVVEAMACGLPVISSDLEFNDDILTDDCSIRVNPDNVDEIAEAMRQLAGDPERRRRMSAAAFNRARQLDLEERAKRIISYIDACVKDSESRAEH